MVKDCCDEGCDCDILTLSIAATMPLLLSVEAGNCDDDRIEDCDWR